MLAIIDYGMGNLRSLLHKCQRLKAQATITSSPNDVRMASKIILPGVGNFAEAYRNLHSLNLWDLLASKAMGEGTPIMGICLGLQLFSEWSEEGNCPGFGWISGETKRFNFSDSHMALPIPHVGWNTVTMLQTSNFLTGVPLDARFYFTHSYHLVSTDSKSVMATTKYGYSFISIIQNANLFGTQFHPEKSHKAGIKLLQNFISER